MQTPQPPSPTSSLQEIKPSRLDDLLHINLRVLTLQHLGIRIQECKEMFYPSETRRINHIRFVDDEHVCELDLID